MRSKEYYKSLILSHAEEIKESIYIIFSPIFFGLYIIFGCHIKLLPFQGARRAEMNTQGECPGLGASAPSGREEGWLFLRIFIRYNLALSEEKCNFVGDI